VQGGQGLLPQQKSHFQQLQLQHRRPLPCSQLRQQGNFSEVSSEVISYSKLSSELNFDNFYLQMQQLLQQQRRRHLRLVRCSA